MLSSSPLSALCWKKRLRASGRPLREWIDCYKLLPCLRAVRLKLSIFLSISPALVSSPPSLICIDGLCLGHCSLAFPWACADEYTRGGRSRDFYEPQRIVSHFLGLSDLGSYSTLACNLSITATGCIKTAYLPVLGRWTDLICKMDPWMPTCCTIMTLLIFYARSAFVGSRREHRHHHCASVPFPHKLLIETLFKKAPASN